MNHPPEILLFAGRLHPLLVHLPIGMIAALAALEIAARFTRFKNANASAGFILLLATPVAIVSAICGWLLSLGGGYDEKLLWWHQWLGIATAAFCLVTAMLFRTGKFSAYRASLFLTTGVLMAAGHFGGSLTHGSGFLTEYAPAPIKKLLGIAGKKIPPVTSADLRQSVVFANLILPVLEKNCVSCHGAEKSKGGLRLNSFAATMKGGEAGAAIKPGDAMHSLLLQRILLPLADDDHMPPAGKSQPSADDLALLKWWIDAGAPENKTLGELNPPSAILKIISAPF